MGKEKALELSKEFRRLAENQPRDWGGASAGHAFLVAAKEVEKTFGLESPPDPEISDGVDER